MCVEFFSRFSETNAAAKSDRIQHPLLSSFIIPYHAPAYAALVRRWLGRQLHRNYELRLPIVKDVVKVILIFFILQYV